MNSNKTQVTKDLKAKSISVSREFSASMESVWQAYTDPKILDQWWGPAPWRAETKTMNFTPGGYWLYAMVGPENQKHWARMNYIAINRPDSIDIEDIFCDENGTPNPDLPASKGQLLFAKTASGTRVTFNMIYPTEADLQKIVDMGFEQGISICFEQLDELLKK
jgi:uncharacterized protein YndB with AHSA1/START domain